MSKLILLVDDDIDSLKLIGLMLKRAGFEVIVADSGGKALARTESNKFDLIITDLMMPDMNGLELIRRLRTREDTIDTPIVIFTSKVMFDDKVKGFEAGADDWLSK